MKRTKKRNILEPDFTSEMEEIAEIPEKVSTGTDVEGDLPSRETSGDQSEDTANLEEVAVPFAVSGETKIIVDEYDGSTGMPGSKTGDRSVSRIIRDQAHIVDDQLDFDSHEGLDIGAVAAEIDSLVKRKTKKEPEPAPVSDAAEDMTLMHRHMDFMEAPAEHDGAVVIEEDDDIDLDYYSLDELKSELTDPLESFELGPPSWAVPPSPKESAVRKKSAAGDVAEAKSDKKHKKDNIITIEVPEDLRGKLPKDFDIEGLGVIDLREAEAIANEDIILLSEEELIEELEEFDLMPRKKHEPPVKTEEKTEEESEQPDIQEAATGEDQDEGLHDMSAEELPVDEKEEELPLTAEAKDEPADEEAGPADEEREKGAVADDAVGEVIVEEMVIDDETPGHPVEIKSEETTEPSEKTQEEATETIAVSRVPEEDGADLVVAEGTFQTSEEQTDQGDASQTEAADAERSHEEEMVIREEPVSEEHIEIERRYAEKDVAEEPATVFQGIQPEEKVREDSMPAAEKGTVPADDTLSREKASLTIKEVLPARLLRGEETTGTVRFIDDELVDSPGEEASINLTVDDLERISSEIIQVVEGEAILLGEGDPSEDFTRIAGIMRGTTPAFEDLLQDLKEEQDYRDDEIGFVSSVFEAEDYSDYIKTIDDQSETAVGKKGSSSIEILGLERREINDLENSVFMKEFEKVNIEESLGGMRPGMDQPEQDIHLLKRCRYIMTNPGSLSGEEQKSIEEDVLSDSALVFEENIDQVKEKLNALRKVQCLPIEEGEIQKTGIPRATADGSPEDISDKVFIIEDRNDLERFFSTIPEDKRENLTKLLKYLDGLFEKLPEEVIRKFASSEYFDIYSKVLNDLGV